MYENTTLVSTTQGGNVSKRTVPAMHHPEYQATLDKSDSVADNRKRRAEWSKSLQREEPPAKSQRCECGEWFRKIKLDRETVQAENAGALERDWQRTLKCQECHKLLPDVDLLYARCEDYGHRSWICIQCFEDLPGDKSAHESQRSSRWQEPQQGSWWSSQSHSSSGWDGSQRDSSGWYINRSNKSWTSGWSR